MNLISNQNVTSQFSSIKVSWNCTLIWNISDHGILDTCWKRSHSGSVTDYPGCHCQIWMLCMYEPMRGCIGSWKTSGQIKDLPCSGQPKITSHQDAVIQRSHIWDRFATAFTVYSMASEVTISLTHRALLGSIENCHLILWSPTKEPLGGFSGYSGGVG